MKTTIFLLLIGITLVLKAQDTTQFSTVNMAEIDAIQKKLNSVEKRLEQKESLASEDDLFLIEQIKGLNKLMDFYKAENEQLKKENSAMEEKFSSMQQNIDALEKELQTLKEQKQAMPETVVKEVAVETASAKTVKVEKQTVSKNKVPSDRPIAKRQDSPEEQSGNWYVVLGSSVSDNPTDWELTLKHFNEMEFDNLTIKELDDTKWKYVVLNNPLTRSRASQEMLQLRAGKVPGAWIVKL